MKVIIVDDSNTFRDRLKQHLVDDPTIDVMGEARNGSEALLAIEALRPDVVLLDLYMPKVDGFGVLREVKERYRTMKVVVLTSDASAMVRRRCATMGADAVIDKGDAATHVLPTLRLIAESPDRGPSSAVLLVDDDDHEVRRKQQLMALIEDSSDVIALLDAEGTVLFVNNAVEPISGHPPSQVIGRNAFDFVHPDDQPHLRATWAECLAAPGNRIGVEYRAKHLDGTWRHREAIAVNRLDNPAIRAIVINYCDITERKQAQAQRELLAAIVESSEDAIIGLTLDGIAVSWNPSAEQLYGYSAADMIGESVARVMSPEHPDELPDILARLRRGEHLRHYEAVRVAEDGRRIDVSLTISPIFDATGAVTGGSSVARDITERKRAEGELRRTTEHLRVLLSSAPIALWALDRAGTITLSEGQLLQRMGVEPGQLVGQSQFDLYRDVPEICEFTRRALQGESINTTQTLGGIVFDTWYSPVRDVEGRLAGTIGVALDVSERHRLEEQFRQAQKMEAVGRLAGGVAHDFNNLLTAILGFSEMTLAQLPPGDPMGDDVQQILNAGQSAASLTRQLLAFSRRQILEPQTLDVNALVCERQSLLRRVIGEDVDLVTTLGDRMSCIHADPGQIEQVVMNLAVNARDAMPSGGTLRIATEAVDLDDAFVAAHPGAATGPHVRLTLTDTGVGMGPAVLAHLFEPFFTTKELGKGTGLGLATVYGIVKQSGGHISVESAPGQGTSFMIHFPSVLTEPGIVVAVEAGRRGVSGAETILLVEDQREVRDAVRQALQRHGYHVLEAADGHAALALLQSHQGPVHLLLTDVVMPHMSGRALADRVTEHDRSVRVLYTSGYTDDAIVRHGVLEPGIDFIQKPFRPAQLLSRVRDVLDRPDRRAES